jgi:hypothetical protein
MTLEEKLDMLSGTGFESKPLPRLGIPSLDMTDGPVGVRWKESVALPASIMLAATFDTSLASPLRLGVGARNQSERSQHDPRTLCEYQPNPERRTEFRELR